MAWTIDNIHMIIQLALDDHVKSGVVELVYFLITVHDHIISSICLIINKTNYKMCKFFGRRTTKQESQGK
jgi:hypothetical protein